jgi:two-component system, OmpR family, phosphate regulon sensor histidine kinase PhoR
MINIMQVSQSQKPLSVARDKQTYKNIWYLFCSFFLSLFYFVLIVPGICMGIGTLIIWLGVPIIFAVMWLWWRFAVFERYLAINWLGVSIAPMEGAGGSGPRGLWPALQARLGNRMTWKALAYLLLKFPLSICCFGLAVALPLMSIGLMIAGLVVGLITAPLFALAVAIMDVHDPGRRLRRYLAFSLSCLGLNLVSLHLLNGLAWLHGQMARALLGMSDTALRLEAARAQATRERERAEQAEQRRHELVVNVSHELRAPVANIAGHLESLLLATEEGTKLPAPTTLQGYLGIAYQEAQRLGQLVDELLSLARMESNELHLDIREVAANEVVEEVYQMLMPLAQHDRQVMLVRGSQPHLPHVLADRQRLVQILQNLVRNAIAYTPAGGIVSISLEPGDEGHLALVVEDNGVGIPPDELKRIFERFYRADASRSRATGGFGLGLAIVHDLVTAMGGSISVSSTVGQGSRFSVLLRSKRNGSSL